MLPTAPVVLISHGLWAEHFGSDPSVLGRTIRLGDWTAEVIGVMPRGFDFPIPEVDVWTVSRLHRRPDDTAEHNWFAIGRLAEGISVEQATLEAETLIRGFDQLSYGPQQIDALFSGRAVVRPLRDDLVEGASLPLFVVFGTAVLVLLISCSNVASLLLVRAESRSQHRAVRVALGSGRWRSIRQGAAESVLLSVTGGAIGVVLAWIGTSTIVAAGPVSIPRLDQIAVDGTVLAFTAGVSLCCGVLFGFLPLIRGGSGRDLFALRSGGHGSTLGRRGVRVLGGLVVAQMALALVLLVGATLLVQSFRQLHAVDPGFEPDGVLTFRLTPPSPDRYRGPAGVDFGAFFQPLLHRLADLPGVTSVGGTSSLPLTGVIAESGSTLGQVQIDEFPPADGELRPNFLTKRTAPGYFRTMGIPMLEGRGFEWTDYGGADSQTAFVISASVKQRFWPDESALGKRLTWGRLRGRVVGVAADVRHESLTGPPDEIVHGAWHGRNFMVALRVDQEAGQLAPALRSVVRELDPAVEITRLRTLDTIVGDSVSRTSFTMTLLTLAAAVALFLGAVGVYGVVSFVTGQQRTEVGVRMALGADPRRVLQLVVRRGVTLAAVGVTVGTIASLPLVRLFDTLLFEVTSFDPVSTFAAGLVLVSVSVGASLRPALRAARMSPAAALRSGEPE